MQLSVTPNRSPVSLLRVAVACLYIALPLTSSSASERRCGWLNNPTPANWWLVDKQATWILMRQGEAEPRGLEKIPDISKHFYIKRNRNYGYTCACIDGEFDVSENRVVRILSFEQKPLSVCQKDRALPRP